MNNNKTAFDLTGKTALVTGGSKGLGYSISAMLILHGASVIMMGRTEASLQQACQQLGALASYEVFDLEKIDQIPSFAQMVESKYGRIDILVNNAGIHLKKDALEVSDDEYKKVISINQQAVFVLSREIGKKMVQRKQGVMIMISSMAAIYGIPKVIAYTAAKSAVEGMTRALAVELSPLGVRVNCIAPGFIATNMSSKALNDDEERMNRVLTRTPMGKLGEPDDVGNAVVYLASEAAKYITGVVLPVDGGNSIGF